MTELLNAAPVGLLHRADHDEPSVFLAANMLREARRQRRLADVPVPDVCVLDPDGDIVRHLTATGAGRSCNTWACYHTTLTLAPTAHKPVGVVGLAVGAPFAVMVAEELFACGCELLISIASAGKVQESLPGPSLVIIDRALRGEGTSAAYLPPTPDVSPDGALVELVAHALSRVGIPAQCGTSWTTDAPFRETAAALARAAAQGALTVEMEAAGLYAFARRERRPVMCLAHVTNALAVDEGDFEKGPAEGAVQALAVIEAIARAWRRI